MPGEVFVDTSAWYPIAVRSHPEHRQLAAKLRREVSARQRIVTTNLVMAETHALLVRRTNRHAALAFVRTLRESPNLVVSSTEELEEDAITDWLTLYEDKDFSFTDAVSFAVMKSRGIETALAIDQHFRIAGFKVVNP